jgi:CrcB protein
MAQTRRPDLAAIPQIWKVIAPYVLVGIGGAIGACTRNGVSDLINDVWSRSFPLATFLVNISGSFILSLFLTALSLRARKYAGLTFLVSTGFLGGYTTFSTFSDETANLLRGDDWGIALLYVGLSLSCGILAALAGYVLATKKFAPHASPQVELTHADRK